MALQDGIHESKVNVKKLFNIDELKDDVDIRLKSGKYTGFLSKIKNAQDIFTSAKIVDCDLVLVTYKANYITLVNYFSANGKNSFKYVVGADYYSGSNYTYIDLINDGNIINKNIFNKYTLEHDLNITTSSKLTATAFNDIIDLSNYTKDDLKEDKNKNLKGFNINAGTGNDIITGSVGSDTISAGLGNYNEIHFDATKKIGDDIINLVKGEKTKLIFKDDVSGQFKFEIKGKDALITVYGQKEKSDTDSTLIADTSKTLGTITIKNIAAKNILGNRGELTISSDSEFFDEIDLLKEAYYNVAPNKKGRVTGTYLNNNAQSTTGVEKFNLGTGSNLITFEGEFNNDTITLNKDEKLRLDFNDVKSSDQLKFTADGKNVKIDVYNASDITYEATGTITSSTSTALKDVVVDDSSSNLIYVDYTKTVVEIKNVDGYKEQTTVYNWNHTTNSWVEINKEYTDTDEQQEKIKSVQVVAKYGYETLVEKDCGTTDTDVVPEDVLNADNKLYAVYFAVQKKSWDSVNSQMDTAVNIPEGGLIYYVTSAGNDEFTIDEDSEYTRIVTGEESEEEITKEDYDTLSKASQFFQNTTIKGSVTLNNLASKDVLGENGEVYATYNNGLGHMRDLRKVQYEVFANKKNKFMGTYLNDFAKSSSKNETFNLGTGNNKIDIDLTQEGGFGTDSIVLKKDSGLDINFIGLSSEEQIEAVKIGNDVVLTVYDEMGDNELGKVKLLNFVKNPTDVDIDGDDSFLFDTFYMDVEIEATSDKTYGTIANDTIFSSRTKNTFVEKYNSWGYCGDNVITSRKDALDTIQISALDKSIEKLSAADMYFLYYKDEDSANKILEISIIRTGRAITYKQADDNGDTDVNLSKVKFIDAEGTKYSFLEATSDTNLAKTNGKTNNIVFLSVEDDAATGLTVTDSKKSDFIYGSDKDDEFIYQNGGFDIFDGGYSFTEYGNGSDTYTVNTFNKKSQLLIMDYDDSIEGDNDTLIFANNNVRDLRLFFDVNKDGKVGEGWNLSIINKDVMADSKGIIKKFSNHVISGSVEIHRYFSSNEPTTEHGKSYIENIFTKDYVETENGLDMNAWTAKIASDVATWLSYHQNYESSFDVFRAGNKVDIESLLKVYSAADYQSSIV